MEIFNTALDEGLELYPSHKPTHVLYKNKAYKIVYSYVPRFYALKNKRNN